VNLLKKLKGERTPEESLAAQPKAFIGCSGCVAILIVTKKEVNKLCVSGEYKRKYSRL
jgi:hypothetical protein